MNLDDDVIRVGDLAVAAEFNLNRTEAKIADRVLEKETARRVMMADYAMVGDYPYWYDKPQMMED